MMSALMPSVMKVLLPLITQENPSRSAVVRIRCRSLPADGSVMPIPPTASPAASAGQPARLLLLCAEAHQVRNHDVVLHREAGAQGGGADAREFLHERAAVTVVRSPLPVEFRQGEQAKQALGARRLPGLPVDVALLLPARLVRHDFTLDEGVRNLPVCFVVCLVEVRRTPSASFRHSGATRC
jgi:hypothetical protein